MKTFEEKNQMIAEFMGYELKRCNNGFAWDIGRSIPSKDHLFPIQGVLHTGYELKFNTSWDWLMSVVDKIYSMDGVELDTCDIETVIDRPISIKLEDMHYIVCQFIEWYNTRKKEGE